MTKTLCRSCELLEQRVAGNAPLWDDIYQTHFWYVVHAFNSGLLGWLVLVSKRHIEAVDELSDEESVELGLLIRRTSLALKKITGCRKTYVMQFAEHAEHPHVHFHIVPRMADQPEERRSGKVFGYLNVSPGERVSEEAMVDLALRVRSILATFNEPET